MKTSVLLPLVRRFVSGCPVAIQKDQLINAAREFCQRSFVWRQDVNAGVAKGQRSGCLSVPAGAVVLGVADVRVIGEMRSLAPLAPADGIEDESGTPTHYLCEQLGSISLYPRTKETLVCVVKAILSPSLASDEIPDYIGNAWGDSIAHGAVAMIMLMPDTDWYNPDQAAFHQRNFDAGIATARTSLSSGFSTANVIASGPKFI